MEFHGIPITATHTHKHAKLVHTPVCAEDNGSATSSNEEFALPTGRRAFFKLGSKQILDETIYWHLPFLRDGCFEQLMLSFFFGVGSWFVIQRCEVAM